MTRFLMVITAIFLCVCLVSCVRTPPPPEPSSMQDVESMMEPLEAYENTQASSKPHTESEAESNPASSISEQAPAPPSEPENMPDAQILSSAQPTNPESVGSSPDILPSVALEQRLDSEKIEHELLRLINEERLSIGAESLGLEENMLFAARIRAGEALSTFSHTRPNGEPYNTAFDEAGFSYAGKWHGENLANLSFTPGMFDEYSAAFEMFNGLKNSPGHYRNMVSDNFLQTGVGVAIAFDTDNISIASVQLFSSI